MKHEEIILKHLKTHNGISNLEAILKYGVGRLSDVIFKLRLKGYIITTEYVREDKPDGSYVRYGVYHLIGEPKSLDKE